MVQDRISEVAALAGLTLRGEVAVSGSDPRLVNRGDGGRAALEGRR